MQYISNGSAWFDWNGEYVEPDFRWHGRYPIFNEEILAAKLKRSLKWVHDQYFAYENDLIVNAYTVLRTDSKAKFGLQEGFVMLQMIYTHPNKRGSGICNQFLEHAMNLAEKEQAKLAAVCRPFVHSSEQTGNEIPSLKQIAKDFANAPEHLVYVPVTTDEGCHAQQKMGEMLKGLGWSQVDLSATMEHPETFGDWAFWI
jgi:GNAT superfamily N-acetyltransferase